MSERDGRKDRIIEDDSLGLASVRADLKLAPECLRLGLAAPEQDSPLSVIDKRTSSVKVERGKSIGRLIYRVGPIAGMESVSITGTAAL